MGIYDGFLQAFNSYAGLGAVLAEDMQKIFDEEDDSQSWKRNYIRTSASVIEGLSHCYRLVGAVVLANTNCSYLTKKEINVISCPRDMASTDRIKYTLRAFYKMIDQSKLPDFGGSDWDRVMMTFEKRDLLMHPEIPEDLEIADSDYLMMFSGMTWLMDKHLYLAQLVNEAKLRAGKDAE